MNAPEPARVDVLTQPTPHGGRHVVQFYEHEATLLDAVHDFAGAALESGGAAILIATPEHTAELERRWTSSGIPLASAHQSGRYVVRDAAGTLEEILVQGWPDVGRFARIVEPIVAAASVTWPRLAIFGEMVNLLWTEGRHAAAVRLEELWSELARRHRFDLHCAYSVLHDAGAAETLDVCARHAQVVPAEGYARLSDVKDRLAQIVLLQHKARALEVEIARRRAVEQALAEREKELSDFLENAAYALHKVDPEGKILWANKYELDLLGYAADEYIGRNIAEFHVDGDVIDVILSRLRAGQTLVEQPARMRCKDGSIRHVLITSNVRMLDGKLLHTRCFTRDVTLQRMAEEALRRSEERANRTQALLAAIVASSDDAVVSKSLDGRISSWNQGAERLFGYSPEEVVGQPITIIIPPELQYQERQILAKLVRGERIDHFETVRIRKDGRLIDVSLTISPVMGPDGKIIGASKVARDISFRKRAEQQLAEMDRHKDDFIAMLGHELRNPLAPIRNVTEVLRRTMGDNPSGEQLCHMLERQVEQMTRLLDDLLDVSRISRGKIEFQREPVSLQIVVARCIEACRPLLDGRRHRLIVSVPDEAILVMGDLARLVQMLSNLVNNATKFTPETGAIEIALSCNGGTAELRVKDNGIGMVASVIPRIFDLYVQADRSSDSAQEGFGIGLALVRSIAVHHGGTVQASSAGAGQGSEFVVRLPIADAAEVASALPPSPALELPAKTFTHRVLIVDDNEDSAESLAALLRLSGHEVETASDGPAALRMAQSFRPDLLLLDIGLPGMSGYEVARRLREDGCDARLAAITGYGNPDDRNRARDAGFDHHFVKPIDIATLERLLATVAPRSGKRAAAAD